MNAGLFIRVTRLPFLTAVIVPVIIGTAVAFHDAGAFNALYFVLALFGSMFIHIGINVANDYFDHRSGNDAANKTPTPFSGGSRIIQDGIMSPGKIFSISILFLALGAGIGAYLFLLLGLPVLLLGAAGIFVGFFYTSPPFKFGYRGLGELLTAVGFGVIVVAGSYYVQTLAVTSVSLLASVPIAVLVAMILFINEFPDRDADKAVNKRTLVVLLGKKRAVRVYHFFLLFAYVYVAVMAGLGIFPLSTLVVLLTLPLATGAIQVSGKNYDKIGELLPANAATIKLHIAFGLLFAAGYAIGI